MAFPIQVRLKKERKRDANKRDFFFFLKAMLLLLLLSHFSRVRLCATPETAAHQAPPSLGFSRQEHQWVAISFSNAWKWKVKVKSLSRVRLLATPWTAAYQAPPSLGFSRQEYWSGVPLPSPFESHRIQLSIIGFLCLISFGSSILENVYNIYCAIHLS